MHFIADISELEMVAEFLKAELGSSRFRSIYLDHLQVCQAPLSIIESPDLSDDSENRVRAQVLDLERGYLRRIRLFEGLPSGIRWKRVALELQDFEKMKYGRFKEWGELTNHTLRVADGVRRFRTFTHDNEAIRRLNAVVADIARGITLPEMILLEADTANALLILEGHLRATAYLLQHVFPQNVTAIVGYGADFTGWQFYPP